MYSYKLNKKYLKYKFLRLIQLDTKSNVYEPSLDYAYVKNSFSHENMKIDSNMFI